MIAEIKNLIVNNLYWIFPVVYLLGSFVYYTVLYEDENDNSIREVVFENVFMDFFLIMFWLPMIVLAFIRLILSAIWYIPFRIYITIFQREKKDKKKRE